MNLYHNTVIIQTSHLGLYECYIFVPIACHTGIDYVYSIYVWYISLIYYVQTVLSVPVYS